MKNINLTFADRLKIEIMLDNGKSIRAISKSLNKSVACIYREIQNRGCILVDEAGIKKKSYIATVAELDYKRKMRDRKQRCKIFKAEGLLEYIQYMLDDKYTLNAVHLVLNSHSKYKGYVKSVQSLYNWSNKGILKPKRKIKRRKPKRYSKVHKRQIKGLSIEKRPQPINDRLEAGHWEMDCVVGQRANKRTLLVLLERKTRYVILEELFEKNMYEVVKALNRIEKRYGKKKFRKLFKSITVDNGAEFQDAAGLESSVYRYKKRTLIYYCHPNAPFERGSNENVNRLVRVHLPKGSNFDNARIFNRGVIKRIEEWINNYPRGIFGGRCSREIFEKEIRILFDDG